MVLMSDYICSSMTPSCTISCTNEPIIYLYKLCAFPISDPHQAQDAFIAATTASAVGLADGGFWPVMSAPAMHTLAWKTCMGATKISDFRICALLQVNGVSPRRP